MDKGYENANEQFQVKYSIGRQYNLNGHPIRFWVQDSQGRKVTVSTSSYNEAEAERDRLNKES